jgi:uncharacterized protein (UPF0335 family)
LLPPNRQHDNPSIRARKSAQGPENLRRTLLPAGLYRYASAKAIHQFMEHPTMAEATDDRLRLLIERIERLEEEKKGIADDIRDVYAEAKAVGYDPKIMRQIVRLRKMKPDDRNEMEMVLDTYKAALGLG